MHMPDCHEGSLYFYLCKRQSLPKLRQFRSIVVELASSHTAQLLTRGIHRHGHRVSLFWSVLRRQYSFCCGHGIQSQSRPQQHHACPFHAAHPNRTWPPHCSGVYARSTSIHMVALHGDHKDLIHYVSLSMSSLAAFAFGAVLSKHKYYKSHRYGRGVEDE